MSTIFTYTGKRVDFLSLRSEDISILDIAHSLSNLCRFAGHTRDYYSVAEHSVRVSFLLPDHLKLAGLLHDAAEAYLVDLPTPLKKLLPGYTNIESAVERTLFKHFGLPLELPNEVKEADQQMLAQEIHYYFDGPGPKKRAPSLGGLTPAAAEGWFLKLYTKYLGLPR